VTHCAACGIPCPCCTPSSSVASLSEVCARPYLDNGIRYGNTLWCRCNRTREMPHLSDEERPGDQAKLRYREGSTQDKSFQGSAPVLCVCPLNDQVLLRSPIRPQEVRKQRERATRALLPPPTNSQQKQTSREADKRKKRKKGGILTHAEYAPQRPNERVSPAHAWQAGRRVARELKFAT
jgi:hypothetical protein